MTTEKEFVEIMKNNLVLQEDGSIRLEIQDQKLADEYKEFVTRYAKKESEKQSMLNIFCGIIILI